MARPLLYNYANWRYYIIIILQIHTSLISPDFELPGNPASRLLAMLPHLRTRPALAPISIRSLSTRTPRIRDLSPPPLLRVLGLLPAGVALKLGTVWPANSHLIF